MSMKKLRYPLFVFLAAAFIAMSVQVSAYSDAEIDIQTSVDSVCPSYTLTADDISVMIKNTGDAMESFRLTMKLPQNGNWSGFISPVVTLSPQEQKKIDALFVTPSFDVLPGIYNITVFATSVSSDKSFARSFTVEVMKCHWLEISAEDYELCQGIESSFKISIENQGSSDEQLLVTASEPWINISPSDRVTVRKEQNQSLEIVLSPPEDLERILNIRISVKSQNSYAWAEKNIRANIRKCYDSEISVEPETQEICPCRTAIYKLGIKNTGLKEDTYQIVYRNKTSETSIDPERSDEIELSFDIPCTEKAGNRTSMVTVKSGYMMKTATLKMNMNILQMSTCYSLALFSDDNTTRNIKVGMALTDVFKLINTGRFRQKFRIAADAPDWVHISESVLELEPNEEGEIFVYMAPPYNIVTGIYRMNIVASAENQNGSLGLDINITSGFPFGTGKSPDNVTPGDNITLNMSIPTGALIGGIRMDRTMTQVLLITILAVGVVVILVLRFVVLMK